jgi:vacuolar-type H+-ATPase subunit E/Vma4
MTGHRLIAAMEEEIAAKIAEVEGQADEAIREIEAEAAQTLAEAQARDESRLEEQLRQYERERRTRLENEWRSRIRNLQFEVAEGAFGELARAAADVRRRDDYPSLWSGLFQEAWAAYRRERTEAPILRTSPADRPLAERQAAQVAAIEVQEAIADGVELLSPDRRLRVVNTLSARLQRGRDEFLKMIADALRERIPT